MFGGKLEQHLWYHEENSSEKRGDIVHQCVGFLSNFDEEKKLVVIGGKMGKNFGTNSMHHQAVSVVPKNAKVLIWTDERLPKNKTVYAFDPKDDDLKIEGLIYEDYPIATVQYHPEELPGDSYTVDLINDLIKCSKNY